MKANFIDLKSRYKKIKPEMQRRIKIALDHRQYILGPEVKK